MGDTWYYFSDGHDYISMARELGAAVLLCERPVDAGLPSVVDKKSIKTAVLSNKPEEIARLNINKFFGESLFEKVYGQKEGVPRKPDPKMLDDLIIEFGIKKDDILYFGDTSTDMLTASNSGVKEQPQRLFDLTSLQREANKLFKFSDYEIGRASCRERV